jgi:hypothetical protein
MGRSRRNVEALRIPQSFGKNGAARCGASAQTQTKAKKESAICTVVDVFENGQHPPFGRVEPPPTGGMLGEGEFPWDWPMD